MVRSARKSIWKISTEYLPLLPHRIKQWETINARIINYEFGALIKFLGGRLPQYSGGLLRRLCLVFVFERPQGLIAYVGLHRWVYWCAKNVPANLAGCSVCG